MSKRLSLILSDSDAAELSAFTARDGAPRETLDQWAVEQGLGPLDSDASAWRALLRLGSQAVYDRLLEDGYERLAAEFSSDELGQTRRAARDRQIRRAEQDA
jgi:hypothetical protein